MSCAIDVLYLLYLSGVASLVQFEYMIQGRVLAVHSVSSVCVKKNFRSSPSMQLRYFCFVFLQDWLFVCLRNICFQDVI